MKRVDLYVRVRFAVQIAGVSRREAARRFGIDPRTVAKMLAFSVPPGNRRSRPPARPKLDRNTDADIGCRERTIRSEAKCRYPPRRDTALWASRLPVAATRPRAPAEREDRKGAE